MSKLFDRLKFSGVLSFGPEGIDLPMEPLNVLIGPNGSGKSNLLEVVSLFQAAPRAIADPISRTGGVREWLWKGSDSSQSLTMEALVDFPPDGTLRHSLTLSDRDGRPLMEEERIEPAERSSDGPEGQCGHGVTAQDQDQGHREWPGAAERKPLSYHRRSPDRRREMTETESRAVETKNRNVVAPRTLAAEFTFNEGDLEFASQFGQEESLLSFFSNPMFPALWHLREQYGRIRLYRNWSFGPDAGSRLPCSAHARSDFLEEGAGNLPLVLSQLHGTQRKTFLTALGKLFDGIVDLQCPVTGGTVSLFLEETGNRSIPATRLSDGTLRYLCLLAVLLHPEPPPLICIEEPELGLHPDLLPTLADLLVEASERSQLIVTTHSDVLVDALTNRPESVVVCEKHDGRTEMRRLDKADLAKWLKDYRLGDLWTSGELGGNRW